MTPPFAAIHELIEADRNSPNLSDENFIALMTAQEAAIRFAATATPAGIEDCIALADAIAFHAETGDPETIGQDIAALVASLKRGLAAISQ